MMILAAALLTLSQVLLPSYHFLTKDFHYIDQISDLDEKLAEAGRKLDTRFRHIRRGNQKLKLMQASCPALRLQPAALLAARATSQLLVAGQVRDQLLIAEILASLRLQGFQTKVSPQFRRDPLPNLCQLPNVLKVESPLPNVQVRVAHIQEIAGMQIASPRGHMKWEFYDDRRLSR